jgi:hypothetical protein
MELAGENWVRYSSLRGGDEVRLEVDRCSGHGEDFAASLCSRESATQSSRERMGYSSLKGLVARVALLQYLHNSSCILYCVGVP